MAARLRSLVGPSPSGPCYEAGTLCFVVLPLAGLLVLGKPARCARVEIIEDQMAYTQTDIDTLKAAIATGATLVKFGAGPDSREVRYRSLSEMESVLSKMQAEVSPSTSGSMRSVGAFESGLGR